MVLSTRKSHHMLLSYMYVSLLVLDFTVSKDSVGAHTAHAKAVKHSFLENDSDSLRKIVYDFSVDVLCSAIITTGQFIGAIV